MLTSTTTAFFSKKYGDEKALEIIKNAGFDAVDLSLFIYGDSGPIADDPVEYSKNLIKTAKKLGIQIGQIHAQMPDCSEPDYKNNMEHWDRLMIQTIEAADRMECPYVVVHPIIMLERRYDFLYEENYQMNLDFYGKMIPTLNRSNTKVAIENMWHYDGVKGKICPSVCSSAKELLSLKNDLGDHFVVCLDTGHTILTGTTPDQMAGELGGALKVLHVHENDGIEDGHDIPYNDTVIGCNFPTRVMIDWDKFLKTLWEINYDGTLNFEADSFLTKYPEELQFDALSFMAKVCRYMANKYEY